MRIAMCTIGLVSAAANVRADEPPPFEVYGFAQADLVEDFRRVDPNWASTLRPTRIPTATGAFGNDGEAIVSARQSRLGVKARRETDHGTLSTKLEFDFFGVGPDEGQTTIRLRHAWGELGAWGGGQTHSPFMDIDVFPNVIDYWGPGGMVFLRNPQVRWTPMRGPTEFVVALEKPSNDIDPGNLRAVAPELSAGPHTYLPDLSAHLRMEGGLGHWQVAGIARQLGWEVLRAPKNEPNGSEFGWGVDLSGHLRLFDQDKLILSAVYGHGIAAYMNDGGVDVSAVSKNGANTGTAQPLLGAVAYYEHQWSPCWSTTFGYSQTRVWNSNLQANDAFHRGEYASVNLLTTPTKDVLAGLELLWGSRQDKDGSMGHDVRAQFSLKYAFAGP